MFAIHLFGQIVRFGVGVSRKCCAYSSGWSIVRLAQSLFNLADNGFWSAMIATVRDRTNFIVWGRDSEKRMHNDIIKMFVMKWLVDLLCAALDWESFLCCRALCVHERVDMCMSSLDVDVKSKHGWRYNRLQIIEDFLTIGERKKNLSTPIKIIISISIVRSHWECACTHIEGGGEVKRLCFECQPLKLAKVPRYWHKIGGAESKDNLLMDSKLKYTHESPPLSHVFVWMVVGTHQEHDLSIVS